MSQGNDSANTAPTDDRELTVTRTVAAPRELVWRAWTEAERISGWWGPTGFSTTTHEMDLRPGGRWRYTMHGPDGVDYPNLVEYEEVVAPERLVYSHGSDEDPKQFRTTVTFNETTYETTITMRMVFRSVEDREAAARFGAVEGAESTLECLSEYLSGQHEEEGS